MFAPYGYTLNSDPVYFDVTADNATEENAVTVVEVVKPNTAQKGVIKISKSGEVFSSATEADGLYQPVFSVQGLPGAVYEITAAEDIITPDGTLRASAGEVVDTVTTDETGLAESKPLYLGKYEIKEITAPYGMILNEESHTAALVYAGQEIEITETSASSYNERQKANLSLDKVLEQNEQFGIGRNGEMSAVTFGLFAAEDLTAAGGSVLPADGLLEILSVDENGHAVCKTDLPLGSFYLKELSTDGHYILSEEKYPIDVFFHRKKILNLQHKFVKNILFFENKETVLKSYEPQELVHFGGNTYCTREHDSLKISNGKWCWFSRGIGGYSALDYLIKVKEMPFTQAMETIMGNIVVSLPAYTPHRASQKKKFCFFQRSTAAPLTPSNICIVGVSTTI